MRIQNSKLKVKSYSSKFKVITLVLNFALLTATLHFALCTFNFSCANAAVPASTNYKIEDYSFGAGGGSLSSTNYGLFGTAGQVEFGRPASANFKLGSGLSYAMQASVSAAPEFTNPSNNYDRLKFVLNNAAYPTDTTFALQISTDSAFLNDVNYVKSDNTVGPTLTTSDFQTYSSWGGASGNYITGLVPNTTYNLRVKSRQGDFTESGFGPSAVATTSGSSLTFSVSSNTVTFDNLNPDNSWTDSSKSTVVTTSTNAYNGYIVNARTTGALTATGFGTISDYGSPNSDPTTWSGTGFGYTTNDNDLTGGTADRFTNGGPKYAGFTTSSPGDPVADHAGPVTTAISNENFTISYRVTTDNAQKAAQYSTTVLYIVVPSY